VSLGMLLNTHPDILLPVSERNTGKCIIKQPLKMLYKACPYPQSTVKKKETHKRSRTKDSPTTYLGHIVI
jgi:hypothetical protein